MKCLKTGIRFNVGHFVFAGDMFEDSEKKDTIIVANKVGTLASMVLPYDNLITSEAAIAPDVKRCRIEGAAPVQPEQILRPRRWDDEGTDLWRTFNRVQENMTKGGLSGGSATGRRVRTRAVEGLNRDVKLNKALWTLADEMAKLVA